MKRFRNVVILMFAFALIVAACSSDDDGGSEETTTTEAGTDTTEAAADLAGTTVTVFGPESSEEEAGAMQDALDVFAEANGMTITYTGARDFSDQINAQAAGGNPPDVAVFPQPGKVIDFGTQGFILPIPADLVEFSSAQWPGGTLETVTAADQVWGLPNKTDLKSVVWYNTSIFADGGYEVPESLDALLALGTQMIADGVTPWCVGIESAGPGDYQALVVSDPYPRSGWRDRGKDLFQRCGTFDDAPERIRRKHVSTGQHLSALAVVEPQGQAFMHQLTWES